MKIALFAPSWPPGFNPNGIVTYASHTVPALRRLGHEVFVLTFNKETADYDRDTIDLSPYISSRGFWKRVRRRFVPADANFGEASSAISAAIRDLVGKHGLDIFETEESFGWSSVVSQLSLVPVVVRLHGPWFLTGRFNDQGDTNPLFVGREKREGLGIQQAHFVTANCLETLQSARKHYGLTLHNSQVIPTPIEPATEGDKWHSTNCERDSLLFVGRFDLLKGGDLVLRAFAELAASNPRLRLTFVGPDKGVKDEGNGGRLLSFEQFVAANFPQVRARIKFCGQMDHADVMSLRTKHFATVIAAQYDTMGYMLLEPMAMGCPLVTTAVGGIPEVIKHERNGLLVPSQDVNGMVLACQKLLEDPSLAARLGHQAWLDCKYYAPDVVARQTVAAYEKAIGVFKSLPRLDRD